MSAATTARAAHDPRLLHLPLVAAVALLPLLALSACVNLSQSVRRHVTPEGQWRVSTNVGLARSLGLDVQYAEPQDRDPDEVFIPIAPSLLLEASAFYGLSERFDLGLRVRMPASPIGFQAGAKLEAMVQLLSQDLWGDPLSLALGFGADGFYRPWRSGSLTHTELSGVEDEYGGAGYEEDGAFNLRYRGVEFDLPLVAAYRMNRVLSLVGALRVGYLYADVDQRYEALDEGFDTIRYAKELRQPVAGWALGLSIELPKHRVSMTLSPQLQGYTVDIPNHGVEHQVAGTFEVTAEF